VFFRTAILCLLASLLLCCNRSGKEHVRSFYYWKTTFSADDSLSAKLIRQQGVEHFYIRYMDVDIDPAGLRPVPRGVIAAQSGAGSMFTSERITPVVFITNRTFLRISDALADTLASNVTHKIADITSLLRVPSKSIKEIQIDCDWTAGTAKRYFRFLRRLKQLNPGLNLSATIRLYPFKYAGKMGVPPVDRGMLMVYNIGGITDVSTRNSIFDLAEVKKYLTVAHYPLPLDVALPVFGWQVWFRGGKCKGIIHNDLISADSIFVHAHNNFYRCVADIVIGEMYFREGDELRVEYPDERELIKAAEALHRVIPDFGTLTFFDWNTSSVIKYETTIETIYNMH
jgi:hypothetical protein